MNKKLIIFNYVALASSLLFSLLQIHFRADISLIAFPLAIALTLILAHESVLSVFRRFNVKRLSIVKKLYQYLPFVFLAAFVFRRAGSAGTAQWYDVLTVFLWLISSVFSLIVLYFLSYKRIFLENPKLKTAKEALPEQKKSRLKKILFEVLDWVDSFVQAICTVALLQIFIFQLYEIPSESMVPEFLVGDRVVGLKIASGPKFPLTKVGLPVMRTYDRGNIVIFRNPQYEKSRASEVQNFISQLVFMISLTTVNLNVDEDGNLKADPLVKRVTGLPGEQLVMQDGIVYSRTAENPIFTPVIDDALWAEWNIAGLPAEDRKVIQYTPLNEVQYKLMLQIEEERNELVLELAQREAEYLVRRFAEIKQNTKSVTGADTTILDFVTASDLDMYTFFYQSDDLIRKLLRLEGGEVWFSNFMTDWISLLPPTTFEDAIDFLVGGDLYSDAMFRQNLMAKLTFGRLAVRTAELFAEGMDNFADQSQDTERRMYLQEAQDLFVYVLTINDMRNMPVFPPNTATGEAQYIPSDNYFVMGDNRFNSLDMRHSYTTERVPLTLFDPWSFYYDSNIAQQNITTDDILGTPILRFFPFDRFSIPGLTAQKSDSIQ